MSLARAGRTKTSRVILLCVLVIGSGAVIVGGVLANFLLTRPPLPEPCTTEALAPRSTPTPLVRLLVPVLHRRSRSAGPAAAGPASVRWRWR